jgi:hypothetical protein
VTKAGSEKGEVRSKRADAGATPASAGIALVRRDLGARIASFFLLTSPFSLLTLSFLALPPLSAQTPADVAVERDAYARWLATARTSPFAAIAVAPIGNGLRLGPPDADVPLDGLAEQRIAPRGGRATLESGGTTRALPPGRPVPVGAYAFVVGGAADRAVVTVFGPIHPKPPPAYFPYDPALAVSSALEPPHQAGIVRVLALDGTEVEATEAGTVAVTLGGTTTRLTVRRLPGDADETDLQIYFRDATSGHGSYPAGRFVSLTPLHDGRYLVDFNRARNPFCAYSTAYPCPAPWPGNGLSVAVRGGERYGEAEGEGRRER